MTAREIKLITKTCKQYRAVSYGQFDQETRTQPEETKDAAEALDFLIEETARRRRVFNNLMVLLETMKVIVPEDYERELWGQNNFGI